MTHPIVLSIVLSLGWLVTGVVAQDRWPQFRGVAAAGVGEGNPPTKWDLETGENVRWKASLEGLAHSAPIVWDDRIYLTTAVNANDPNPSLDTGWVNGSGDPAPDKGEWSWKVICLGRANGQTLWEQTVKQGVPAIERHSKATHANCTPATDGQHVVAFFGSEGLYCFDRDGKQLWSKDLGKLHSGPYNMKSLEWGFASSPIIHDDRVIVQCDCLNTGFVLVLDIANGQEVLRIQRDDVATWSTPAIVESSGVTQIVCNGYHQMASYNFSDGKELWTLKGGGDVPVPTPLFEDGLVFLTNGHGRSPIFAIDPDARGDLSPGEGGELPEGLVWFQRRGGSYMPTPILVDGLLYNCNDNGVLTVRSAKTGEEVYATRVSSGGDNNFSASAVAAGGHLYFCAENGNVIVVRQGEEFERVAVNKMQQVVMATPAIAGDDLLIRTTRELICIGNANHEETPETPAGR